MRSTTPRSSRRAGAASRRCSATVRVPTSLAPAETHDDGQYSAAAPVDRRSCVAAACLAFALAHVHASATRDDLPPAPHARHVAKDTEKPRTFAALPLAFP